MFDRDGGGSHLGSFMTGLMIGGLAAGAAMLFMAPQSGKKTRKLLQRKSDEWRDQAEDLLHDARETAQDTLELGRKRSRHLQKQAVKMSRDARSRAEKLQDRGQDVLKSQRGRMDDVVSMGKDLRDRIGI